MDEEKILYWLEWIVAFAGGLAFVGWSFQNIGNLSAENCAFVTIACLLCATYMRIDSIRRNSLK